jgi:hypothetical protein
VSVSLPVWTGLCGGPAAAVQRQPSLAVSPPLPTPHTLRKVTGPGGHPFHGHLDTCGSGHRALGDILLH